MKTTWLAKIKEIFIRPNLRRHRRIDACILMRIFLGEGSPSIAANLRDISEGGCNFFIHKRLDQDHDYKIVLKLVDTGDDLEVEIKVARALARPQLGGYETGAKFLNLTEEKRTRLLKFISHLTA